MPYRCEHGAGGEGERSEERPAPPTPTRHPSPLACRRTPLPPSLSPYHPPTHLLTTAIGLPRVAARARPRLGKELRLQVPPGRAEHLRRQLDHLPPHLWGSGSSLLLSSPAACTECCRRSAQTAPSPPRGRMAPSTFGTRSSGSDSRPSRRAARRSRAASSRATARSSPTPSRAPRRRLFDIPPRSRRARDAARILSRLPTSCRQDLPAPIFRQVRLVAGL